MKLRIDPWDPGYGSSVEIETDLGAPVGLSLDVEVSGDWEPITPALSDQAGCCAFIDGVRRVDARLFAEEGEISAPALAGSWAVGSARSCSPARIDTVVVGRSLVVGGGMAGELLNLRIGTHGLAFAPRSVDGCNPMDPLQGLQNAMRDAEGTLAQEILARGDCDLVVSDGPLTYFNAGPAVGMVKRQSRAYLEGDRAALLRRLAPGQRTPLFKLGEQRLERYSWYLKLAPSRAIDGVMASVVRLEVAARDGLDAAVRIADLSAATLPRFAPAPGRDPRAPQNLYPIGALEQTLRHRLGDPALVHRALEVHLNEELVDAA
jgi:hypothetical protein